MKRKAPALPQPTLIGSFPMQHDDEPELQRPILKRDFGMILYSKCNSYLCEVSKHFKTV